MHPPLRLRVPPRRALGLALLGCLLAMPFHAAGQALPVPVPFQPGPHAAPPPGGPLLSPGGAPLSDGPSLYLRYCALCHAADGSGHAADHASSLRSQSLLATASNHYLYSTLWYGSQFGGTDNWRYETTEGYLENTQLPGLVPVNRFHNSSVKGYYMTTNPNWSASYYGFVFERTEGYASNTQDMCGCSTPMYWAYSSAANNHFFTTNKTEYDQAVAFRGYSGGGVAFYVYATQQ